MNGIIIRLVVLCLILQNLGCIENPKVQSDQSKDLVSLKKVTPKTKGYGYLQEIENGSVTLDSLWNELNDNELQLFLNNLSSIIIAQYNS